MPLPDRIPKEEIVLDEPVKQSFRIQPFHMGTVEGLDENDIDGLLEIAEGPMRRG